MAVQTDGKIVVAGGSSNGSSYDFAIARYNTGGSLDTTFGGDRKVTTSRAGISVAVGNVPARRAYEAIGFQLYMTYGVDYFEGAFPSTTKYRIRINAAGGTHD